MDMEGGFLSKDERFDVDSSRAKDLICIEYPGVVANEEAAIQTLGGMDNISKAFIGKGYDRLELRFRPNDSYCKPTVARPSQPCCLALKIKRRKTKQPVSSSTDGNKSHEYSVELLGTVSVLYEFTGMADFQLLPPGLNNVSSHCDLANIDPLYQLTELHDESIFSIDNLPEFIPPITVFSKLDRPANYCFKPDFKHNLGANTERPIQQIPGRARIRRSNFTYGISFHHKEAIPSSPKPFTPNSNHPKLAALKQLFEERPVWTRGALQAKLKISSVTCKQLLPLVSYNFTTGPWRNLWVRFEYDPRASPDGKKYQTLDFRVPKNLMYVISPSKNYQQREARPLGVGGEAVESRWKAGFLQQEEEKSMKLAQERLGESISFDDEGPDVSYVFDPDCLPQQRQQFYQLCDLHADSLQAIIHSNDGRESGCNEVYGWCEEDVYDKLRKQIIALITAKARKEGILLAKPRQSESEGTSDVVVSKPNEI